MAERPNSLLVFSGSFPLDGLPTEEQKNVGSLTLQLEEELKDRSTLDIFLPALKEHMPANTLRAHLRESCGVSHTPPLGYLIRLQEAHDILFPSFNTACVVSERTCCQYIDNVKDFTKAPILYVNVDPMANPVLHQIVETAIQEFSHATKIPFQSLENSQSVQDVKEALLFLLAPPPLRPVGGMKVAGVCYAGLHSKDECVENGNPYFAKGSARSAIDEAWTRANLPPDALAGCVWLIHNASVSTALHEMLHCFNIGHHWTSHPLKCFAYMAGAYYSECTELVGPTGELHSMAQRSVDVDSDGGSEENFSLNRCVEVDEGGGSRGLDDFPIFGFCSGRKKGDKKEKKERKKKDRKEEKKDKKDKKEKEEKKTEREKKETKGSKSSTGLPTGTPSVSSALSGPSGPSVDVNDGVSEHAAVDLFFNDNITVNEDEKEKEEDKNVKKVAVGGTAGKGSPSSSSTSSSSTSSSKLIDDLRQAIMSAYNFPAAVKNKSGETVKLDPFIFDACSLTNYLPKLAKAPENALSRVGWVDESRMLFDSMRQQLHDKLVAAAKAHKKSYSYPFVGEVPALTIADAAAVRFLHPLLRTDNGGHATDVPGLLDGGKRMDVLLQYTPGHCPKPTNPHILGFYREFYPYWLAIACANAVMADHFEGQDLHIGQLYPAVTPSMKKSLQEKKPKELADLVQSALAILLERRMCWANMLGSENVHWLPDPGLTLNNLYTYWQIDLSVVQMDSDAITEKAVTEPAQKLLFYLGAYYSSLAAEELSPFLLQSDGRVHSNIVDKVKNLIVRTDNFRKEFVRNAEKFCFHHHEWYVLQYNEMEGRLTSECRVD